MFKYFCMVLAMIFIAGSLSAFDLFNPVPTPQLRTTPLIKLDPPSLTPTLPSVQPQPVIKPQLKPVAPEYIIYHPSPVVRVYEAAKAIEDQYRTTATKVSDMLNEDLQKLKSQQGFYWESEEEKKRKLAAIRAQEEELKRLREQACQEARECSQNWKPEPDWKDSDVRIKTGPAFRQLQNISIRGW